MEVIPRSKFTMVGRGVESGEMNFGRWPLAYMRRVRSKISAIEHQAIETIFAPEFAMEEGIFSSEKHSLYMLSQCSNRQCTCIVTKNYARLTSSVISPDWKMAQSNRLYIVCTRLYMWSQRLYTIPHADIDSSRSGLETRSPEKSMTTHLEMAFSENSLPSRPPNRLYTFVH